MRPSISHRFGRALLAAVISLGSCAPLPLLAQALPPVEQTRSEFEALCQRALRDNAFFGQPLPDPGPDAPPSEQLRAGIDLIRAGRLEDAVSRLEGLLARSEDAALPAEMRPPLLGFLAIAHFLLAEDENCIGLQTGASCIVPFRPEAIHTIPEHTRRAGDLYRMLVEETPNDVQAVWLLNLSRMVAGDPVEDIPAPMRLAADVFASRGRFPVLQNVAPLLGVDAFDLAGGAVTDDFDGDGLLDLVTSSWDPCSSMKAFRNDGRGGFEEVGTAWGLDALTGGLNLVQADYDGDGDLDLLVLRGAWQGQWGKIRNSLLRNDLNGPEKRFVDVSHLAGLAYPAYPTQTGAWADYDGDGDLDLYVGNESESINTDFLAIEPGREAYPSQLFQNQGDGTFVDVTRAAGVRNVLFAKGVAWGDYDDDGDPDLYVSNIGPNRLYRNEGDGTFTDVATELGVLAGTTATFATWFFDYDNDGDLDLWVGDYTSPAQSVSAAYFGLPTQGGHPIVYRNDFATTGRFTDVSAELGLDRPVLPMGANYGDLDGDGWQDVYLGTGLPSFSAVMPNVFYRNAGGRSFEDLTFDAGLGHLQKGHAVAFGDLDNDGDLDLFQQLGGAFPYDKYGNALYLNPLEHRWLSLELEGRKANRRGIGARITVRFVERAGERSVHLQAGSGGSFGASSLRQEIGLGEAERIVGLEVRWPGSGTVQTFTDVPFDRHFRVTEGEAELVLLDLPRVTFDLRRGGPGGRHHPSHPAHHARTSGDHR